MTRRLREVLTRALADSAVEVQAAKHDWSAVALTLLFAAAAVLFVSFLAVISVVA